VSPEAFVPVILIVAVVVVMALSSRVSGWFLLAEEYPCPEAVTGRVRWFSSVGLRRWEFLPCNYGGIVILTFAPEGLRFSLLLPFRLMHEPFLVPWREFANSEVTKFLFIRQRTFRLAGGRVRMDVDQVLGEAILDHAKESGAIRG
jgi:hypothetical protein